VPEAKKLNQSRVRPQRNGLFQPYTVMVQERPYVVEADSIEDAVDKGNKLAAKQLNEDQGDVS
jgi:hypothetical protein